MTKIDFVSDKKYGYSAFSISGHSGYSDEGSDIVCAYISSAAELTLGLLIDSFGVQAKLDISDGDAYVKCVIEDSPSNEALSENIRKILTAFHSHLGELQKQFPENVKISERKILL